MVGKIFDLFGREREPMRDVGSLVEPLSQPAVRITVSEINAQSHFGGAARLPAEFEWPRKGQAPLTLLAQLDLAELATAHQFDWLPVSGTLAFFYDLVNSPWGFNPEDAGGWHVHYAPAGRELVEHAPPADIDPAHHIARRSIAFHTVRVPPGWERPPVEALELTDRELDALGTYRLELFGGGPQHQIGGFPDPVQGDDMELECQLVSHGLFCGDPSGHDDPRAAALEPGARNWRLLLQFDSDDELHVMWGDLGKLYFWVREDEARRGEFGGAWMCLQCS